MIVFVVLYITFDMNFFKVNVHLNYTQSIIVIYSTKRLLEQYFRWKMPNIMFVHTSYFCLLSNCTKIIRKTSCKKHDILYEIRAFITNLLSYFLLFWIFCVHVKYKHSYFTVSTEKLPYIINLLNNIHIINIIVMIKNFCWIKFCTRYFQKIYSRNTNNKTIFLLN